MPRLPRSLLPDGIYHITTRGVDRCPIYRDDDDRRHFLKLLAAAVARFRWSFHALCLMGNHYHLVVESTRAALSDGMRLVNGRYAQEFNLRYGRTGHLFGDRFACRTVADEESLERVCDYVVHNPVRHGFCERASEWRWGWSRYGPGT